jgi:hypothetical protein
LFGIEPGLDLAEDRHTSYLAQVAAFVVAAVSIRLQKTLLIPQPVGRIGPHPVGGHASLSLTHLRLSRLHRAIAHHAIAPVAILRKVLRQF